MVLLFKSFFPECVMLLYYFSSHAARYALFLPILIGRFESRRVRFIYFREGLKWNHWRTKTGKTVWSLDWFSSVQNWKRHTPKKRLGSRERDQRSTGWES